MTDQSNVEQKAAAVGARKNGDAGIDRSLAIHEEPLHQLALADRRVSEQDDFDAVSRGGARQRGAIIGACRHDVSGRCYVYTAVRLKASSSPRPSSGRDVYRKEHERPREWRNG